MTSRERVQAAFSHEEPDRVPAWCGASEAFWSKNKRELGLEDEALRIRLGDDFRRVFARDSRAEQPCSEGVTYVTVFGVERTGLGYGQPLDHPLSRATLRDVCAYAWPDPLRMDVSSVRAEAEAYEGQYAILGGDWSPFWHDLIDLLGMENMFLKMYDQPELIDTLLERIVDYYAAVNQRILDAAGDTLDVLFIGNDFGSQTGALLSEPMFRRFLLPHLARLVDMGHAYGLKVMLHCCGGFVELIPAMIEIGLDGLHALQPCCPDMAPRRLKRMFGDKIVLNGAIDSHHVLIKGSPGDVRDNTRKILQALMPGGGYIAGASHDAILEETPTQNVLAMFDAIREFGCYD